MKSVAPQSDSKMYTRSSVQDSTTSLPRDWRRITVNLLHCQNRAELFISPEGRRFHDLKSAKAWIASSIETSYNNSEIIESPRKFRWRKAEEKSEEESKYSPENVRRRKARFQGRKNNRNLLQTALKKKFKIRVTKSRVAKSTSKPLSKISKTKDRIKKATVTRIKATFGFNRRL